MSDSFQSRKGDKSCRMEGALPLTQSVCVHTAKPLTARDILGSQPHAKAVMLGVNTIEFFLEEFT